MSNEVQALIFNVIFALVVGFFVARKVNAKEPTLGGPLASVLSYIAGGAMITILPAILCNSFVFHNGFDFNVAYALTSVGITLLALMGYAALEMPARATQKPTEDRGWTEEDARKSGL